MIISHYMKNEHRECDTFFAEAEEAVAKDNWEEANEKYLPIINELIDEIQSFAKLTESL